MKRLFYMIAMLAGLALTAGGVQYAVVVYDQDQLHIQLAKLDVEYAKIALENRETDYARLKKLAPSIIPTSEMLDAKYAYQQAVIDYERSQVILRLTEETGRYYGLGGRATVP